MSYIYTPKRKLKDKPLPPEFKGKVELKENEWVKKESPTRISYPQDWHNYDKYQTSEKLMFYRILNDAINSLEIDEKAYNGQVGRPYNLMRDMLKACCIKIFCNFSSRRIISELKLVQRLGYIQKVPHYSSIARYFNSPEIEKHLSQLYRILALPLKNIENKFAVDSTGFSTSVKSNWVTVRFGKEPIRFREWKKLHIITGVLTNIVISAEITKSNVSDQTQFPCLVTDASRNFKIGELSADAGYLARKNVQLVCDIGGTAYIMPRKDTKARAGRAEAWHRMIRLWMDNKDEFKRHYHLRSNVESTFSMIKRKFSTSVRSKNDQAQKCEILAKLVCHNISVLVSGIFELDLQLNWN